MVAKHPLRGLGPNSAKFLLWVSDLVPPAGQNLLPPATGSQLYGSFPPSVFVLITPNLPLPTLLTTEIVVASCRYQSGRISELNFQHFFNEFPYNKLSLLKYLYGFYFHLLGFLFSLTDTRDIKISPAQTGEAVTKGQHEFVKREKMKGVCISHAHTCSWHLLLS